MRANAKGMSMVEVLVALTILVIAVLIALLLYDASRKSFKKGENATEQQQAVRIAFDKLNSDLRMAGFNTNPDGAGNRPDEQIEGAWDTAVVFRGDFDAEDPTASATPESTLDGGAFQAVSTGNDEVVLYALARPDGTGPDSLTFNADMQEAQRDGDVEAVTINNLVLNQNPANAPYTLYRITFNNNAGTWNTSSFVTRTPLVENVRSMQFKYYDLAGNQINSVFNVASLADDIGGAEAAANLGQRSSIRRVEIRLEGLTREPDLNWTDASDVNAATKHLRKFELTADVTPRNLGLKGLQDINSDFVPPQKPATPTLVAGHCGGLIVNWTANPLADGVSYYTVSWGTSAGNYSAGSATTSSTSTYISGLTNGTTYYVVVSATDAASNVSQNSDPASATPANTNTPSAPGSVTAVSRAEGRMDVAWAAVTTNTAATSGDPASPMIRDLKGYRVYREATSGFTPAAGNRRADETTVGPMSSPSWQDTGMVACRVYYWKVTAVDTCAVESAASVAASGASTTNVPPMAPGNLAAYVQDPTHNRITWDAVTQNTAGVGIAIDTYRVFRSDPVDVAVADGSGATWPSSPVAIVTGGVLQYIDALPSAVPPGKKVFYRVTAVDDCPNESAPSNSDDAYCAFGGTVAFTTPSNGATTSGVVTVTVRVDNPSGTYTHLRVDAIPSSGTTPTPPFDANITGLGPWTFSWTPPRPGGWTLTANMTNAASCTASTSVAITVSPTVACCLTPQPIGSPVNVTCRTTNPASTQCTEVSYLMKNNNCLTSVGVDSMTVTWSDVVGNSPLLNSVWFDRGLAAQQQIWNAGGASSPASTTFTGTRPIIPVGRDTTNPMKVTYIFSKVTSAKISGNFKRDTLTTVWNFELLDASGNPTGITGSCGPGIFDNLLLEQHN